MDFAAFFTSFRFFPVYKNLKHTILPLLEEEKKSNTQNSKKFDYGHFLCNLSIFEDEVLISNFIIFSFFLAFEIILKYKLNSKIESEKRKGKITLIVILINFIFFLLLNYYGFFILFRNIYFYNYF